MILSTSVKIPKTVWVYGAMSLFCLAFFLVYDQFSHGVHSSYMTFLFAWPLFLGFLPNLAIWISHMQKPSANTAALYNCGVATLTMASLLKGIFDIAGTASDYQIFLMILGDVMVAAGMFLYFYQLIRCSRKVNYR